MNPPANYDWQIPQRQAPAGLIVMLYKTLVTVIKSTWWALLYLIFRSGERGLGVPEYIVIGISAFVLVRSMVEFFYFRFYIENDELIIKKGFISKKNIAIPLHKIQAVHIEQNLLHQLLEVVKVKIDTAGSEKTEAVIDAISVKKAEQLKTFLLHEKQQLSGPEEPVATSIPEKLVLRLGFTDMLKLGFSANHIQTFFIVLAFVFTAFQNLREAFGDRVLREMENSTIGDALIANVPVFVLLVLLVSVTVSLVRILLKYFDLTLSETQQAFKLKAGLINTRQFLVPFTRIQFISWEANWVRRKVGLYTVELHQVSGNRVNEKQRVKVPVTRAAYIEQLFSHYHELVQAEAHSEHRIHRVYPFRRLLMAGLLPVLIILPFTQLPGWNAWWLLLLIWLPYKFINAWFYRKNFRLFVSPDAFQVNSGIWGREVRVIKWYKIQQVELQQSIYQRSHRLATIKLKTAGGNIKIPFISLELANRIQNYALYEVERSYRPWI